MADSKTRLSSTSRNLFILLVGAATVAGAVWWVYHSNSGGAKVQKRKGDMPFAVAVATVQKQDVGIELTALGTVTSTSTVTVRSRVDGQLDKVHFIEGELVKQGQLLAELDPRPYQATLTQTQGQLLRDQALLKNAELDLVRYQQLQKQDSIATQQVDTQKALVQQYEGTVKLDQGLVDNAQLQLTYSRITAPVSGRVGLRQVDPGNIVHASDSNGLVVITQIQPINVVFAVPETSLSQVLQAKKGSDQLKVAVWDRDNRNRLAEGTLLAIDNQLNASTGTVNLKARFANEQQQLFPNQFVNVHLQLGKQADAITVPTAAVQLGKVGSYTYTVNPDQTVGITKITTGFVSGDNTIITQGLQPGQRVVVDGLDKLRDGAKVEVIDRTAVDASSGKDQRRDPNGGSGGDQGKRNATPAK